VQLILNKTGETVALTPETLSQYSVDALSAMSDLMAEILDKMAFRYDTRAKFAKELGNTKILIDAQTKSAKFCPRHVRTAKTVPQPGVLRLSA
jgi:hypothetical protein